MPGRTWKVLSISDVQVPLIYNQGIKERFSDIDLVLDCGDLPYYYGEYILTALNVDLYFVRGNHSKIIENATGGVRSAPRGGVDLHKRVIRHDGLILAGVEGSLKYRDGPFQYDQNEMWMHVFELIPALLLNRIRFGRFLDIFATHAPPYGIHDQQDLPHQGIKAFRWFDQVFKPAYHFHGHIHVYRPDTITETLSGETMVINTYGYRVTTVRVP